MLERELAKPPRAVSNDAGFLAARDDAMDRFAHIAVIGRGPANAVSTLSCPSRATVRMGREARESGRCPHAVLAPQRIVLSRRNRKDVFFA